MLRLWYDSLQVCHPSKLHMLYLGLCLLSASPLQLKAHGKQDVEDAQYSSIFTELAATLHTWTTTDVEGIRGFSPGAGMGLQWLLGTSQLGAALRKVSCRTAASSAKVLANQCSPAPNR